ncbi:Hsp70 family protein [Azospirillum halopraeferens]|uniref:Hsp70 family protein n=1 Tax=Azospirillum halopraeferens TaxID=34010 RepID=UPI000423EDED|nr:Hsp70 family protein [Azospirillum halopraeferens]
MAACGLDFGTSNTTLGAAAPDRTRLVSLEGDHTTLPSALFFDFAGDATVFGRAAVAAYAEGEDGRLMRSIKSVLGTDLIDADTTLNGRRIAFRAVIATFLGEVRRRGERAAQAPLDAVVHGRPVHFVDGDPAADAAAEAVLAEIARAVGFADVSFQYEPIAAALDYERRVDGEELALIADIGGGTSDFSIVRLGRERRGRAERGDDILANDGIRVGGTDFDRDLSIAAVMPHLGYGSPMKRAGLVAPRAPFLDLATWSKINFLYTAKALAELKRLHRDSARPDLIARLIGVVEQRRGHALAMEVERAKIALSGSPRTVLPLDFEDASEAAELAARDLVEATGSLAARIGGRIDACLAMAGLPAGRIDAVFLTGGSTLLPHVRAAITDPLPDARVVTGDTFGSVGQGLTLEAQRRYGTA